MSVRRDYWVEHCAQQKRLKEEKKLSYRVGKSLKKTSSYLIDKGGRVFNGYADIITKTDGVLEEEATKIINSIDEKFHKFEVLQNKLGIKIFKSRFSANINGEWVNFFVVDLDNPTGSFTQSKAVSFLQNLHREEVPFKIISRLRKTVGDVEKISAWVEKEFSLHSHEWKLVQEARFDPALWITDFRRQVDMIANAHQSWRRWLIIPAKGMSEILTKNFTRLDKNYAHEFLFDLFQSMDENDYEIMEFFKATLAEIREGKDSLNSILPSRTEVEKDEIVTSDGIHMHNMDVVVTDVKKVIFPSEEILIFKGLDWLKQRLSVCLSDSNRTDQIWISVSHLPVKNRNGLISNIGRHYKSYSAGKSQEDMSNEKKSYLNWLDTVRTYFKENPKMEVWQQSTSLLLKSNSKKDLIALKDFVSAALSDVNTWFEEAKNEKEQWLGLKRMLPAIWKEEVLDNNNFPRNTLPIPRKHLESIFVEDKFIPSKVGALVGMLFNGMPLVVGFLHWGVIGSTSVGKSIFLKAVCAMLYPIDPLHTELFVADLINVDPDDIPPGWYTLLIDRFGGVPIFPQKFKTPKDMREALNKMVDKRVFLYMPNKDVDINYDLEYLKFVLERISKKTKKIRRRVVAIDELDTWFDKEKDSSYLRARLFSDNILSQGAKNDTTCCYSVKTLEGVQNSNVDCWSQLKVNTEHWLIFNTSSNKDTIPESIGFPPRSKETTERADQIVNALHSLAPYGGLTPQDQKLGRCVLVTGGVTAQAKIIVPEGLLSVLHRKDNNEWGA